MQNIGFIGLGHMGTPMAMNLINAGFKVTVFDIVPEASIPLVDAGGIAATTLLEAICDQDVIITMLQTGEQVKGVCLNDDGIYTNAKAHTLHIDCSSIDVDSTRELHQKALDANLLSLDAPVSGGVVGAENAALTIMVGGKEQAFQKALPILEVVGKKIIHAGKEGNGQVAKICNNMILGISMIAISEAFNLGEKLGLSTEKLFEISSNASGQCWSMTSYCPVPGLVEGVPSNNDYKPGFSSQMMLKDLLLSQDAARSADFKTTLGATATQLYEEFVKSTDDDLDFSAIIQMLENT